jgi:hypothetical protein
MRIQRTFDAQSRFLHDMCVKLGGGQFLVTEQFLDRPDIQQWPDGKPGAGHPAGTGRAKPPPIAETRRLEMAAWTGPYNKPTKAKVTLAFVGLLYNSKSGWAVRWAGWRLSLKTLKNGIDPFGDGG